MSNLLNKKYVIGKHIGEYENNNLEFKRSLDKRKATIKKYVKSFCNNYKQISYIVYGVNDEGLIVGLPETSNQLDNVQKEIDVIQEEICIENNLILVNFIKIHIINCYTIDNEKTLQNMCILEINTKKLNNYYIDPITGQYYQLMMEIDNNVSVRLNASSRKIMKRLLPPKIIQVKLDKLNQKYNHLQLTSAEKIQQIELCNKILINQLEQANNKNIEQLNEIHKLKQHEYKYIIIHKLFSNILSCFEKPNNLPQTSHNNKVEYKINSNDLHLFDPLYI